LRPAGSTSGALSEKARLQWLDLKIGDLLEVLYIVGCHSVTQVERGDSY